MSAHFEFFSSDIEKAIELARAINWPSVFKEFDVVNSFLRISASSGSDSYYKDVAAKLDIIFELPFLRANTYAKLRNEALLLLCQLNNIETSNAVGHARRLIHAGADVNYCDKKLVSCLGEAIRGQSNDALSTLLIEAGAVDIKGRPALLNCKRGETVKLLFSKGFTLSSVPVESLPSKLVSMESSAFKALVIENGIVGMSVEAIRQCGKTRLQLAASMDGVDKLTSELTLFGDVDIACDEQMTALMYASCRTDSHALECVELLLEHAASANARDSLKKTALMWAVECAAQQSVIAALLKRKPDIESRDQNGNTALHYCAARKENLHISHVIAEMLLEAGAEVNAVNDYGHTPLMLLVQNTPKACAPLLLRGAMLDVKDHLGHSVYDHACPASKKALAEFVKKIKEPSPKSKKELVKNPTVVRSRKTAEQVAAAKELQGALFTALESWTVDKQLTGSSAYPWSHILLAARLGSEGIKVVMESVAVEEVDRIGNMLSGPFFVSIQYPMVEGGYPVVQLDLRLASALSGKVLGDGLLQMWEVRHADQIGMDLITRVIPRESVSIDLVLPFDIGRLRDQRDTALNYTWESDPAKGTVKVFKSFYSVGFQTVSYEDSVQQALEIDSGQKPPEHILKLVERFHSLLPAMSSDHDLQLFGCFKLVQYDLVEVGKDLLFTIPYGSWGSAEVFYDITQEGKVNFSTAFNLR